MVASVEFVARNAMVDSAEAAAEQLVLGVEDSGTDLAPCVGTVMAA